MKQASCIAAAALILAAWVPGAGAQVTINEIRIDNIGADTDEYFELMGPASASLDSLWYIVLGDGAGADGEVENVISLDGLSLNADGLLSVHHQPTTGTCGGYDVELELGPFGFENSDNVTHMLVRNFTGALNDDLDTNDDGTLDSTPWDSILDCVALIETVGSGDLVYCATQVGPDGSFVPGHVFRCGSSWVIGSFQPTCSTDTPGEPNGCTTIAPEVFSLRYSPCVPTAGQPVTLSVVVTDANDDINTVKAFFDVNQAAMFDSLDMSVSVDSLYTVNLPGQADQSLVNFYVVATDLGGNVVSNPASAPGFTRSYRVGEQAISAIQGNTVADSCLSSALDGQAVNVRGVVTHHAFEYSDDFFYIQDGTGPNSGIKIFAPDSSFVPDIGDEVLIAGFVDEFRCATEVVMFADCGQIVGTDDVVARTLTTVADIENEVNESMLVTITGPLFAVAGFETTTVGNFDFLEFLITANTDTAWVGDDTFFPDGIGYTIVPEPGMEFDAVTGIVGARVTNDTDSTTVLRLEPRRDNDVDRNFTGIPGGDEIDIVRAYRLNQNEPNPFNPITTIAFEIPRPGTAHLVVYDVSGRVVRRLLAKQYFAPTRDRVTWNGRDDKGKAVPSGIYFYRLEADGWSATRKMLLLK